MNLKRLLMNRHEERLIVLYRLGNDLITVWSGWMDYWLRDNQNGWNDRPYSSSIVDEYEVVGETLIVTVMNL